MSGGHFEYQQYRLHDISEDIKELIASNNSKELNEYGDKEGRFYSEDTISAFKEAIVVLNQAAILTQRIDYLVSGDDGENTFHSRLKEELMKADGGSDLLNKIKNK